MKKILVLVVGLLLLGANVYAANGDLTVNGTLNVGAGGVKFPDGSTQTTAISPKTQNNVTASRALGTVYQNTTGKPMFVSVICYITANYSTATAYTDSNSSPNTIVSDIQPYGTLVSSMFFIVLPGNYYKVAGTMTLKNWIEWY